MDTFKNNPKSKEPEVLSEAPELILINDTNGSAFQKSCLNKGKIHLIFCLEGHSKFGFGPVYTRELKSGKVFMIYNPDEDLNTELSLSSDAKMVWLKVSLIHLHQLFVPELQEAPLFKPENAKRKFYEEKEINPSLYIVLNQLFDVNLGQNSQRLYFQAKAIEILSLFFSEQKPDTENCPFLNDEHVVRKLRNAKDILINNYVNPPTIIELSKQIGLNEFQLKAGFKEIYGNTPYQYLLDHKLEIARQLIISGKYQVNEVAFKIGYNNISHFIEAFKKKYGVTPKKMMD